MDRAGVTVNKIFDKVENAIALTLLGLMALVAISATLELAYVITTNLFQPPGFFIGIEDLLKIFGLFLMILIGLELMSGVRSYFDDHRLNAELMLLVAVTALTRKIVILDTKETEPAMLFAIGFTILALTVGYYFLKLRGRKTTSN